MSFYFSLSISVHLCNLQNEAKGSGGTIFLQGSKERKKKNQPPWRVLQGCPSLGVASPAVASAPAGEKVEEVQLHPRSPPSWHPA